jgi:hypothetical protein
MNHSGERDISAFSIIDLQRDASIFFKKDPLKKSTIADTFLDRTDVVLEDLQ